MTRIINEINKKINDKNNIHPFIGGKTQFKVLKSGKNKGAIRAPTTKDKAPMVAMTFFDVDQIGHENIYIRGKTAKVYRGVFKGNKFKLTHYDKYLYLQKE